MEDKKNLYFPIQYKKMLYPAVYNKIENKLLIMNPVSIPPRKGIHTERIALFGYENDLDGGLPFWPKQIISNNEMMCIYTADELLKLDVSKITDEKLKKVLNSIDEYSNPVIAIVTLKN